MMMCRLSGATMIACPPVEGLCHNTEVQRISALMESHVDKMKFVNLQLYNY